MILRCCPWTQYCDRIHSKMRNVCATRDLSPANATFSLSTEGGALNVTIVPKGNLPLTPTATGLYKPLNDPIFEPGWNNEIRADGIVPVGPGTSYHVLVDTWPGSPTIASIKVHADIGNPETGGKLRHAGLDVGAARVFSVIQGGIPGCAVKFN
jgi:hypothetical protein